MERDVENRNSKIVFEPVPTKEDMPVTLEDQKIMGEVYLKQLHRVYGGSVDFRLKLQKAEIGSDYYAMELQYNDTQPDEQYDVAMWILEGGLPDAWDDMARWELIDMGYKL